MIRFMPLTGFVRSAFGYRGGGIRSATFNLGLLQGLCDQGLLPYIDYLSTVSGGGYIGSGCTVIRNKYPEVRLQLKRA